ncbi:disease resistance protein ADR2-like [Eucalyptus grandis]|uniref:disease resistance protein ADR2-like n=1 Tax=Eucalyptus grandis TaxID=71139 RepID=UPI00192EB7D2|nr:disease resistance protein ADR2-like [Eucalyptus grandis]
MENLEDMEASTDAFATNSLLRVQIGNGIHRSQFLRILILDNVDIHALPTLPKSLINLQVSILWMDTFPDLSNLINLEKMDLSFGQPHSDMISNGLGEHPMPEWFGELSKLKFLALHSHHGTTSPTNLTLPPRLKSLHLKCPNLRCLPRLPLSLSSLKLEECWSLCSMEDLSNLKELSSLHISSAAIAEIQGLGCLENLRDLHLYWLGQVKILPDLSNLNKLTSLLVGYCDELVEIQGQLPRFLDFFRVDDCGSLQKLPDLSSLMDFEQLQILPDLSNSNQLRRLLVHRCDNLVEIQGELPQSLEVLHIESCKSLQKLPNVSSSTRLQEVCIRDCNDLVEIQGVA